ncbi:o-succinylbenzoate synthase [aff. Roholtiella sp. LEGE 12411]|uniref:o-succinylbenzoate synthase n=1 Tax=aff. Roholtiella sp. LEGE 12411 TaxID=1828822 RepID=UPI00187F0884|nr:o-succinylbenzoate synthase [aff. Roholtiella sp. LEGE 12411]
MTYKFKFRPYRRRFVQSLTTSHGIWDIRDGIILNLTDETGRIGWGEIAPISWFGSETIEQALNYCRQLPEEITDKTIFSISDELPACQFGFESAREWMGGGDKYINTLIPPFSLSPHLPLVFSPPFSLTYSALLPAGEAALSQWETLWQQGYRTFKWKIGVYAIAYELEIFNILAHTLPASTKLRLDANGGFSYEEANLWLWTCDNIKANEEISIEIEFIEQPLPIEQFQEMLALSIHYGTAIALDESVATLNQLTTCYQQGWQDIFVIKPGIVGSPSRLRQFCQQHQIDAVFSSVFETAIARLAALQLAAELSQQNRAVGFGVNHFFEHEQTWLQSLCNNL